VFDSKRARLFEIFEYLPSPISYLFNRMTLIFQLSNQLKPGKRATAVFVWRPVFAFSTLFDTPSWGTPWDINAVYTSL